MNPETRPNARLLLPGHDPAPARVELTPRTPRTRMARSAMALLGWWAIAPLVFFLPPHIPWALGAVAAGIYFALKQWRGEYVVHGFGGACPRCGAELSIPDGARIRLPHRIDCFACHHASTLQADALRPAQPE